MKKSILFTGAALLAFCSCTNEVNEAGFKDRANSISFRAYSSKTRANVVGDVTTELMKQDNFGVFGYYNNSPYLCTTENGEKKAVEQTWVPSGTGSWDYKNQGDVRFWPNVGTLDFYAYFPYSDNATYADNNTENPVMTIPTECGHDVLFAKNSTGKTDRVSLTFHHAFSKIQKVNVKVNGGNIGQADMQVEISEVEFINTSTKGDIQVDKDGKASYKIASSNTTVKKTFSSPVKVHKDLDAGIALISEVEHRYLFATNATASENQYVTGTGKKLWDGTKDALNGAALSSSDFVCLKLTCKATYGGHYLVGDENSYGVVYIPLAGTHTTPDPLNSVSALLAGKRYIYNIIWSHNIGYTDGGDPILDPILFNVSDVDKWDNVNVTIEL